MHLLKDASLFVPESMGKKDLLIGFGKILGIYDEAMPSDFAAFDVETVDCLGKTIVPGFFDTHVHITGGGGEGGYTTRIREGKKEEFVNVGTTSVIGVLGTDCFSRSLKNLLAKTRELNELGMNAFMTTGSYKYPPVTITGELMDDVILVPEIIGSGEFAVSDHRGSGISAQELKRICLDTHVGGMVSKKSGKVIVHMGEAKPGMKILREVIEEGVVPVTQMIPTHMSRCDKLLEEGKEWVKKYGGYMDLTAKVRTAEIICELVEEDVDLKKITVTSDGLGSWPVFNENGEVISTTASPVDTLLKTFKKLVTEFNMSVDKALLPFTRNPATFFDVTDKGIGVIKTGGYADFIVFDEEFNIENVYLKSEKMM